MPSPALQIQQLVPNVLLGSQVLSLPAPMVPDTSADEWGEDFQGVLSRQSEVAIFGPIVLDMSDQDLAEVSQHFLSTEVVALSADEIVSLKNVKSECEATAVEYSAAAEEMVEVVIKFDTGCSGNMSGVPGRIDMDTMRIKHVSIKGFNGASSFVDGVGTNEDNKDEYFVSSMPRDLALLCAHEYTKAGATVLFPDGGSVVQLTPLQQQQLRELISQYPTIKKLIVRNRTYEVDQSPASQQLQVAQETAHSSTATRYFNTFNSKINVSFPRERVLAQLLTGSSFKDLYSMVKNGSVDGLPRDLTLQALNRFEHDYGRTPDVLQLAMPNLAGNSKGYMAPKEKLTHVGQRVEADYFESEFNESFLSDSSTLSGPARKKVSKLATHGGAIAGFVAVDCFSGKVTGRLVQNMANSVDQVEFVYDTYTMEQHRIDLFAADTGILRQSSFQVMTPAALKFLQSHHIAVEAAEPHNHNQGTPTVERVGRTISELQRFALLYILNNPNFPSFGFTKLMMLKTWGELFYWAIEIINLKSSPADRSSTKFAVFHHGRKPDLRSLRLFPIFCSLYVLRRSAHDELNSTHQFWQFGLYVGPSRGTPGAVRVAVLTNGKFVIITSSAIKAVSDGGNVDQYKLVQDAVSQFLDQPTSNGTVDSIHELESPVRGSEEARIQASAVTKGLKDAASIRKNSLQGTAVPVKAAPPAKSVQQSVKAAPPAKSVQQSVKAAPPAKSVQQSLGVSGNIDQSTSQKQQSSQQGPAVPVSTAHPLASLPLSRGTNNTQLSSPPVTSIKPNTAKLYQPNLESRSRAERMKGRNPPSKLVSQMPVSANSALEMFQECKDRHMSNYSTSLEECNFVDWSTHEEGSYYVSFEHMAFVSIVNAEQGDNVQAFVEEGYRAVTEGIPRHFQAALSDPEWGAEARAELNTVTEVTKCIVACDQAIAMKHVAEGADVLRLIAVYEEKIKDGVKVRKVRLVADGRRHTKHGSTYASTPSREELFTLLSLFATEDMDYYHVDEVRAFLSAPKLDQHNTYVKFSGDSKFYKILNALYGLKTASHDHQQTVIDKLELLGFKRCGMCSCIYVWREDDFLIITYVYVDDFIFGGNHNLKTMEMISEFRKLSNTTEPILNAELLIGMEIERVRDKNIILVRMTKRIEDLVKRFPHAVLKEGTITEDCPEGKFKKRNIPMPSSGFIVKDYELDRLEDHKKRLLAERRSKITCQLLGA